MKAPAYTGRKTANISMPSIKDLKEENRAISAFSGSRDHFISGNHNKQKSTFRKTLEFSAYVCTKH